MREDIKSFLCEVERPGRYTGGEPGSVIKDKSSVAMRVAFCFPDTYEIGMSNLGMRILCGVLNEMPEVWCERVFAPWTDMEEQMRRRGIPLFAHESGDSVREFDMIGITLQYELCYTTALNMLDLAGLPLYAAERGDDMPVVLAGGPCAYNPEPMADFVDIFSIGEGEEALPELAALYLEMKKDGSYTKKAFLSRAAKLDGFYVPSLYNIEYKADGTVAKIAPKCEGVPQKVKKRIVEDVDSAYFPTSPVLPIIETVHDRITLEVFRGCIRGCRFCQAGFISRPVREKKPETLCRQAKETGEVSGYEEISLCSLSISDYSRVNTLTDELLEWTNDKHINLSLPSLRADSFTRELMDKVSAVRQSTITFAPEAGSQRLRDVINKNVTEEDVLRAAGVAFSAGKNQVKLYFMNGLPYETDEDIVGIAGLAKKVIEKYYATVTERKKRPPQVTLSVACFIPKPFTPFQWVRQNTAEELERKQKLLLSALTDKKIRYHYHDARVSRLEAVFARGNRRLSAALAEAVKRGIRFDAWDEHFDYDKWMDVFAATGIDPAFYAQREMGEDEVLPWDMIDCGVKKEFLLSELHRAKNEATTPSCREKCSGCGANSAVDKKYCRWCPGHEESEAEYLGHGLSPSPEQATADDSGKRNARGAGAPKNPGKPSVRTVRLRYSKGGAMVYVSHLDLQRCFLRAISRSGLPVYYTEGFNPIPKITFALPLSLGAAGERELVQIKLIEDVSNEAVKAALTAVLPADIKISEAYTGETDFKKIKWAENEIVLHRAVTEDEAQHLRELFTSPLIVTKRSKSGAREVDITPLIDSVRVEAGDEGVIYAVTCADSANYLNPVYIARAALESLGGEGYCSITRKMLLDGERNEFI